MVKINKYMSEHMEQVHLFAWIKKQALKYQPMELIFAIPNGGVRSKITGARMKAEGVKAGVPDIFVPIPARNYHGAFLELKSTSTDARLSKKQAEIIPQLTNQGYCTSVCHGHEKAIEFLSWYLNI